MKEFVFTAPVRFTHTDPAGYVFFPRFFEMIQATVEDWFNFGLHVNYADLILVEGIGLPTAHTECDFKAPCRLGELIDFTLTLEKIGTTSMTVYIVGRVNGEERLTARSVLVAIDMKDGRPVPFSAELRKKLEEFRS
jgi:4-hydroxybenzoyl-CoA thioesterase